MSGNLKFHEEIMLLALRDKEGTPYGGTYFPYALAGAILAELLLTGRVRIEQVRKKKFLTVIDPQPVGNDLLDMCLGQISSAKRRATTATWVSRLAGIRQLRHRVARNLCQRGILRADEEKVLLLFTRKIYPEVNPEPEREIIERLRQAIFTDTDNVAPRTVVLLSLTRATGLLKHLFDKKELRARKRRIEQLVNGEIAGAATKEAIEAMQAAVMVAGIIPAIIASTGPVSH